MNKWRYKLSVIGISLLIQCLLMSSVYAGKLAIVIDDIGYRTKEDGAIFALPKEVSIAIIPVAPYATARATKAFEQKRDILIHLPMEPQVKQAIEARALLVGMNELQITTLIKNAQLQVPNAIGLNNHMGSKATADKTTMQYLMKVLSQHHLSFLDSKTAANSVGYKIAKEYGVNALERHIFLDDSDALIDVQKQFNAAVQYARKNGSAIMIGHPRKNSIKVLEQNIASLPKDIQLVGLKELWGAKENEPVKPFIMLFDMEPALTSKAPYQSIPLLRGMPKE